MIEIKESSIGLIISGTVEEMEEWKRENGPIFIGEHDSIELKLTKIRSQLEEAGVGNVDIVYDYIDGNQKIRVHKRATALEFNINDNPTRIAHRLGWHRFD